MKTDEITTMLKENQRFRDGTEEKTISTQTKPQIQTDTFHVFRLNDITFTILIRYPY